MKKIRNPFLIKDKKRWNEYIRENHKRNIKKSKIHKIKNFLLLTKKKEKTIKIY